MSREKKNGKLFSCYLDKELYEQLHNSAVQNCRSITGELEYALKQYFLDSYKSNVIYKNK